MSYMEKKKNIFMAQCIVHHTCEPIVVKKESHWIGSRPTFPNVSQRCQVSPNVADMRVRDAGLSPTMGAPLLFVVPSIVVTPPNRHFLPTRAPDRPLTPQQSV